VLYLDTPENAEVAGGAGIPFERNNLSSRLELALDLTPSDREQWISRAVARVQERYSWDAVTDAYEKLMLSISGKRG
jgi:glycosyltransferase involved in cell wall biosynthesis